MDLPRFRNLVLLIAPVFASNAPVCFRPVQTQIGSETSTIQTPPTITEALAHIPFHVGLKGRQAGQDNAICGWIDGNGASAVSCFEDYYCATQRSFVGCCASTSCSGIVTKCYDILGDICNASCRQNVGNLVCGSTLPYCATYRYSSGSVGYGCARATGFEPSVLLSTTTSDGGTLSLATESSTTTSSTTTSSTTTAPASTSTSATPTPQPSSSKDGLSSGAIAGIVIGSVVAICLIGFLAFWIYKTRRDHRIERERYQASAQGLPFQDRSSYGSPQPPSIAGRFSPFYKGDPSQGSPPLSNTAPVSPYGSDFNRSPRNSYPMGYPGPTMAEMAGDPGVQR